MTALGSDPIANGSWMGASDLKPGYRLLNGDQSWAEVVSVSVEEAPLEVFNLSIDGFHTFFVAGSTDADPVRVHYVCFGGIGFNINRLSKARQDAVNDTLSRINKGLRPEWGAKKRKKQRGADFHNNKKNLPAKDANGRPVTYKEYEVRNV